MKKISKKLKLLEITLEDFNLLKKMGMLWEFYPDAPDKEKFDEVFEDEICLLENECREGINKKYLGIEVDKQWGLIATLAEKYLGDNQKVKISAKKGKIIIEKIGE